MVWKSQQNPNISVKVNFRLISGNSGGVGSSRDYAGMSLVDRVVNNKSIRVVAAQAAPTPVAAVKPTTQSAGVTP